MPEPTIQRNVSLQPHTTLRVPARAGWFAEIDDADQLATAADIAVGTRPLLVLGEGSNCLFTGDYDGLVLRMAIRGITVESESETEAVIRVGAGENWHAFLRWSLEQGYSGIENLALIPGTVGAAPIQNIGAYGVEVERCIDAVEAWDGRTRARVTLSRDDCGFAYRDSIFKQQSGRFIVTAVVFRLHRQFTPVLGYAGLEERLAAKAGKLTATDVADAVESLRREKLPDPATLGNAGSFFKNPVVPKATAAALHESHPDMPVFPQGDAAKLSAGWLIEQAGLKGYREGDAGISERHALVLVNHGAATGEELWSVAAHVRDRVQERFGIELEPEPRVY